ncbi:VanW family protein [Paenibacillus cremeus]|uniref:G5 domain-containing protein n=1 Tax=Paenibacillus cremeus TaxID=2163881 RepID=A0A559KB48_9BACL|nr:VanW family protein [Paenibacillus cremeus]TVY09354.1 hypothetical protein FPZ49_14325 [Paenibacillus cremeus]
MAHIPPRVWWLVVGSLLITLSAFITIAVYGSLPTLPAHVTIGDWSVGGMPAAELERQLQEKKARLMGQPIRLMVSGGITADLTLEQLGLQVDEQEIKARLRPLREGSMFQKALYKWHTRGAAWTLPRSMAGEPLTAKLKQVFPQVYARQPVNAQRVVQADDTIRYVPESRVEKVDEEKLASALNALLPTWGSANWAGSSLLEHPSRQPATTKNPLPINVPMKTIEPKITVASLQLQGITRKISEFTTNYPPPPSKNVSTEGRIYNVCSTAASIQDVVLKPGEVFDYAPYIEQTSKNFGFKEAPVILNGKLVPGIGGGICQVSSTLYNAVLRAGLEIVERRNHSLPISYVPLGQDATFATGYINFKFRNSSQHSLLIRTEATDRSLTVKLFGQTPPELTYDIESKTIETLQPPVKYVLNPTLPSGKQEVVTPGKPGYIVETYRYKKQNGVVVSQEKISRDTYSAQPTLIASNSGSSGIDRAAPGPGGETPQPLIEDGVKGPNFR